MKRKILLILLAVLILVTLTACSQKKTITIASKPMTEQFVIAEMLIALIEEETDITVEHKAGVGGGTSNIHPAIVSGEIDIYPEYTGTGWMFVLEEELIKDPDELYKKVKEGYKEEFNIVWSKPYGFNDTFGISMKREKAEEMGIKTYSDLAASSNKLVFGAEHDFFEREDGFPGIDDVYAFDFKKEVGMDIGLKYLAIESGEVDVINIFSTDGKLKEHDMVVLEDDKYFFLSYFAASLIRQETLDEYPELERVLSMLDGKINNDEMTNMNYLVEIEKMEAKEVAINFLEEKGLLK